jgi:hypothetical protein
VLALRNRRRPTLHLPWEQERGSDYHPALGWVKELEKDLARMLRQGVRKESASASRAEMDLESA